MWKNFLKIAYRNVLRYKGYSFINIAGMAVGMACCILILLWVQDELSFDRFHANGDRIYRVVQDINFADHSTSWAITQGPLGPALKDDFAEIDDMTRSYRSNLTLRVGDVEFQERGLYADSTFFRIFTFPLVSGNPQKVLTDTRSILLSEELASKYFGDENPIGKTLTVGEEHDFFVSGVFENIPGNSHMRFDYLLPMSYAKERGVTVDQWGNSTFTTYVLLGETVSYQDVIEKISGFLYDKPTLEEDARLNLQPLTDIHLYSHYEFERTISSDIKYVYIFSIIALSVLAIACFNFMNLTTARSVNRAREVGLRKVVGATKSSLGGQFLTESILLTFVSLLLAILIIELALPSFNTLSGKELHLAFLGQNNILWGLIGIALLTGILAGGYPAFFLSSFQPAKTLKSVFQSGSKGSYLRKVLVIVQFALSILLISGSLIIYHQLNYMRNRSLGYDKENIIYFSKDRLGDQFEAFRTEILKNPRIINATAVTNLLTNGRMFTNSRWQWEGKNPEEELLLAATGVDYDFFETFKMEMAEGRGFLKEFMTDTAAWVVNETAAAMMGFDAAVGKQLSIGEYTGSIIGVVRDYHLRSLHAKIEPLVIFLAPSFSQTVCVRISSENIPTSIEYLEEQWEAFNPGRPFNYSFLDEALNELYRTEERIGTIVKYFTFLAIFLSCLGLFGLAAFAAEQRTKEIGIRKVLGATVVRIVHLLSKDFLLLVIFANVIAWPIAWLIMNGWLKNYPYRIKIGVETFILAGLLALIIALLTVSFQAVKAALADPVKSLRYE
jgi:ABC-type antimicrobial peptide transport system permease subunit